MFLSSGVCKSVLLTQVATLLLASATDAESPKPRTWISNDGNYKTQATYIGFREGMVLLRKSSGSEISVPMQRLSIADQDYIKLRVAASEISGVNPSQVKLTLVKVSKSKRLVSGDTNTVDLSVSPKLTDLKNIGVITVYVADGVREQNPTTLLAQAKGMTISFGREGMIVHGTLREKNSGDYVGQIKQISGAEEVCKDGSNIQLSFAGPYGSPLDYRQSGTVFIWLLRAKRPISNTVKAQLSFPKRE